LAQKIKYNKPYKSPTLLVSHLKNKGLLFTSPFDEAKAAETLERVNYFRFKSYLRPFLDLNTDNYHPNTEFKLGLDLYDFDCELRTLCNKYLLKLEIKLRSKLDQTITSNKNDPFWYIDNNNFSQSIDYIRTKISKSIERSSDEFARHYRDKYMSPLAYYKNLPPFWIAAELTTFGMLSDIIKHLIKDNIGPQRNNPLDILAHSFGANNWKELKSWIPLIKEIRNCCSHSNRTWNRNYRLPGGFVDNNNNVICNKITKAPTMKNKLYLGLAIIHAMTKGNMLNNSCFKQELKQLLSNYSHLPNLASRMGIPIGWELEPIWQ
jgi:abortive infection bacteriophage resistance protein